MSNYTIVNGQLVSTDELYHYGVKGMRWGVRRAEQRLATAKGERDLVRKMNKTYMDNSRRRAAQEAEAANKISKRYGDAVRKHGEKRVAKDQKKVDRQNALFDKKVANRERKAKIERTYDKILSDTDWGERATLGRGTMKVAARYVVDHNMSVSEARKKANKTAMRATGAAITILGAMSMADLALRVATR